MLILLFLVSTLVQGQTYFAKRITIDKSTLQEARRILRTPDDKFLVIGYVMKGSNREGLVFKMDGSGNIDWAKAYGGSNWEEFYDVTQVGAHYYCVGYTRSFVNAQNDNGGSTNVIADIFLVKIKLDGTLVWAKNMGKPTSIEPINSATNGNDIAYRLAPSGTGGVVVMARINSGQTTQQESGMIWVEADGTTRWANQYNLASHANNNELTYSIWKDDLNGFITGGYAITFGFGAFSRALMYKVDEVGDVAWCKSVRSTAGIFESQFYGYFNRKTGKIYSTDYFSQTSGAIREMFVCTNMASTGDAPAAGAIPQAKRYHYGSANSSANTFRSLIIPVGDGYENFLLAAYDITAPAINTTRYAHIAKIDEELNLEWTRQVGVRHDTTNVGFLNQINDALPCDDSGSFIAVGTLSKSNGQKQILVLRISESDVDESAACDTLVSMNQSAMNETTTTLTLTKIDLTSICNGSVCWADDRLIENHKITVSSCTNGVTTDCSDEERMMRDTQNEENEETYEINNIVPEITMGPLGLNRLAFKFLKPPMQAYFEITSIDGNFVFERFWNDMQKLHNGIDVMELGLPAGEYVWEIIATYEGEINPERKVQTFKWQ